MPTNSETPGAPGACAETVQKLLDAGRAAANVVTGHNGEPFLVIPNGYKVQDISEFLPPYYINTHENFEDADSFSEYLKRFKDESTLIFGHVDPDGCKLRAILDYHMPGKPARLSHSAMLRLAKTCEWSTWMANDRKQKSQMDFCLFLEENDGLFVSPPGAELREMIQTLELRSSARFNSAVRLQNGTIKFTYEEDVELRGMHSERPGEMVLPSELICGIAPFEFMKPYEVKARLRYRLADRKLTFWYETVNPHLIIRNAADTVIASVEEVTGLSVLRTPASGAPDAEMGTALGRMGAQFLRRTLEALERRRVARGADSAEQRA